MVLYFRHLLVHLLNSIERIKKLQYLDLIEMFIFLLFLFILILGGSWSPTKCTCSNKKCTPACNYPGKNVIFLLFYCFALLQWTFAHLVLKYRYFFNQVEFKYQNFHIFSFFFFHFRQSLL